MTKRKFNAVAASVTSVALVASMSCFGAGTAMADTTYSPFWTAPSSAVTPSSNAMTTYGVRAGSAGADFVGIANTNYDISTTSAKASYAGQVEKAGDSTSLTASQLTGYRGAGLAIWATSVNESVNPYYANLYYSITTSGGGSTYKAEANTATTWISNPESSAWGDSNNSASVKASDGTTATIAGLEYNPDIIFGANKAGNWGHVDAAYANTNIAKQVAKEQEAGSTYDPTFTNNDSTNLWTQIYTINQLGTTADALKATTGKTTRYDNNSATTSALSYEKALRGNLLYIASQIDQGKVEKKTVAYLYAIDTNGVAWFFTPEADGLVSDADTNGDATSTEGAAKDIANNPDKAMYAGNNGTIDLDYMDTLPFITNTFSEGEEATVVMKVEDIFKANPAVKVFSSDSAAMDDVDVVIYNTNSKGVTSVGDNHEKNGNNSSGIEGAALTASSVKDWIASHRTDKSADKVTVIGGDDWGTSSQESVGNAAELTDTGISPLLYCARNYTTDKPARAAWAFSQVYSELYDNVTDSYAYWVDTVYHINTDDVDSVVKYMTNMSKDVTYTSDTYASMEAKFQAGLDWWNSTGVNEAEWNQYAYYNGSSRASYYYGAAADEEPTNLIGIFEPTQTWQDTAAASDTKATRLYGENAFNTMDQIIRSKWASSDTVIIASFDGYWDALSAASLAGIYQCPIIMTSTDALNDTNTQLIKDLGVKQAIIVGGTAAVSADVESQVNSLISGKTVRVYGDTAADTAVEVYKAASSVDTLSDTAIIATVDGYWDALAASSAANSTKSAIFLASASDGDSYKLNDATLKAIQDAGYKKVIIMGGTAAVSSAVETQLGTSVEVKRFAGSNAIDTAAQFADYAVSDLGMSATFTGVATIDGYWDALAGSALCGVENAPILLVSNDVSNDKATAFLKENSADVAHLQVFGGTAAINNSVVSSLTDALK